MPELARWDSFYIIVGSAAGALIGLQFVVLTLIAERPPIRAADAGAAFSTPTIVHFGAAFFLSALLRVPWETITIAAVLLGLAGFSGMAYTLIVARRMRRQTVYRPVFEDWLFHVVLPSAAYATLALSSLAACTREREALFGVGGAALLLLFIGIHNAWDAVSTTCWSTRRARANSFPRSHRAGFRRAFPHALRSLPVLRTVLGPQRESQAGDDQCEEPVGERGDSRTLADREGHRGSSISVTAPPSSSFGGRAIPTNHT